MNIFNYNRIDLVVKYLYFKKVLLENCYNKKLYIDIYKKHIMQRTNGTEREKNSIKDFLTSNEKLFNSMKINGWNKNVVVPVYKEGGLDRRKGGSHRLGCAKALGLAPKIEIREGQGIFWTVDELCQCLTEEELKEVLYHWALLNLKCTK